MASNKKLFILDTNVLIHDPESIFSFEDNTIIIPMAVLEELDEFKTEGTERGRNSRQIIRYLDSLRSKGSLTQGIRLDNGGTLKIVFSNPEQKYPEHLTEQIVDNEIIQIALNLKAQGFNVKFVSKDLNARVKADTLSIEAVDYLKDTIKEDHVYTGRTAIQVPAVELKKEIPEQLIDMADKLTVNEFITVESNHNPHNYNLYRYLGNNNFKHVNVPKLHWPLEPRNPQQLMALDLLLDPSIQLVSLIGPAGTGKTFLALLAGLQQILIEEEYEKMLITRPVVPLGPDIGFLPGDIQEKLQSWMQPIYDNMEVIIHSTAMRQQSGLYKENNYGRYGKGKNKYRKNKENRVPSLEDLVKQNKLSLEAIAYMRGRSIPFQYIIIDEVQNLTVHEIKTIISRAGEGSKIILLGDPYQIDSPYLDFRSNGLTVATSKFKGQELFGTVFLEISERSELSRLASKLL